MSIKVETLPDLRIVILGVLYGAAQRRAGPPHRIGRGAGDGRRVQFTLQGHVPLEFALANTQACQVRAGQRTLTALRPAAQDRTAVQQFKLPDAAAQIQILCPER